MSIYLVEDETINRLVEWLYWNITRSQYLNEKISRALGIDTTRYQWYVKLLQAMFDLNIDGLNARYGESEAKHFCELSYQYTQTQGSTIQVLKSLECWLYQCMEGDVVKKPFYRFLRDVVELHLMSDIICDIPEYDRAVWE